MIFAIFARPNETDSISRLNMTGRELRTACVLNSKGEVPLYYVLKII